MFSWIHWAPCLWSPSPKTASTVIWSRMIWSWRTNPNTTSIIQSLSTTLPSTNCWLICARADLGRSLFTISKYTFCDRKYTVTRFNRLTGALASLSPFSPLKSFCWKESCSSTTEKLERFATWSCLSTATPIRDWREEFDEIRPKEGERSTPSSSSILRKILLFTSFFVRIIKFCETVVRWVLRANKEVCRCHRPSWRRKWSRYQFDHLPHPGTLPYPSYPCFTGL